MGFFTFLKRCFSPPQIKKGIALGSGGAKGAAEIGVLRAFEEENIKFDMVAGTSIGAVIGAMLSLGFTSEDMQSALKKYRLAKKSDMIRLKTFKGGVEGVLKEIFGEKTFGDTLIPFCAVACDIASGEEVDMKVGSLAKAVVASGAIPPVFRPIRRAGRRLIDGAAVNAVPCDKAKELGADIVIGVALHNDRQNTNILKTLNMFYRGHGVKPADRMRQTACADYMLYIDLKWYTSADLKKMTEMENIGYSEAKKHMAEIKEVLSCAKKHKKWR